MRRAGALRRWYGVQPQRVRLTRLSRAA